MGAPKGNQFWKLRSKHGRDKIFATPEILWDAACEYFEWCEENPWEKQHWVGKDGDEVTVKLQRPFTLHGLCVFLGVNTKYFNDFEQTCGKDFSELCTRIKEIIYSQKFEGAAVGLYNANIIARDLGLRDNQDLTTNGESFNITIAK